MNTLLSLRGAPAVALVLLIASCSSDENSSATASTGAFSTTCVDNASCQSGLVCSQSGASKGLCTISCEKDSDCQIRFGDASECVSDSCVMKCKASPSACPSSSECSKHLEICTHPVAPKNWTCTVTGGICECRVTEKPGELTRCPSELDARHTTSGFDNHNDVCCELGGPTLDPSSWNYCVCQNYMSIPDGDSCYSRPIANGVSYGPEVKSCPDGAKTD